MNELTIITCIYDHHAAAFTGLAPQQRAAVRNAIGAGYQAGLQAQPTNDMPPALDGFDSEKQTAHDDNTARLQRVFEQAGPVPDDMDEFLHYLQRVDTLKREGAVVREAVKA